VKFQGKFEIKKRPEFYFKISSLFLFFVFGLKPVLAQQAFLKDEATELQLAMNQMSEDFFKLRIFARSDKEFSDPKNDAEIKKLLANVVRSAKITHKNNKLSTGNYVISSDALIEHLVANEKLFLSDRKDFARWTTVSTQFVCMSCHTQFPSYGKKFELSSEQKKLFSDFEQAEFLFASRDYDQALLLYEKILANSEKYGVMDLEKSAERIVVYYARLRRDFKAALAKLQQIEANVKAPDFLKSELKMWIEQSKFLLTLPDFDPKTCTEKQILDLIKKLKNPVQLKNSENLFVIHQYVAGLLYEFLKTRPPSKVTPEIMYELAVLDDLLDQNFFFSLGDIYLRECISRFPKSKAARRCYAELEERTVLSFTGSRGVSVPKDVQEDLKKLKKLLK